MSNVDSDIRGHLAAYRNALETFLRAKYAFAFCPELFTEAQVVAPMLARLESKVQAAEINMMAAFKGSTK